MADVVYQYGADVKQILEALNQIDKSNEKVYKKAEKEANRAIKAIIADHNRLIDITKKLDKSIAGEAKEYDKLAKQAEKAAKAGESAGAKLGQSSQTSGIQLGIVSGIVQELTRRFIDLGQAAIGTLVSMSQEAVKLASELKTTQAIFTGVFQGNETAAVAALEHIREQSRGLGIDLQEVSRAFLPFVSSLQELDRVNKIAGALAISQPEQGALGARIALQEALSGNVQSLVRRFEIPKTLGKELQRALDEGGTEAFLTTFEGIMKRLGRDIDSLTDTFQFSFSKTQENLRQLQTAFGVPITDELKGQFDELNKVFETNFDDFEGLAKLAGQAIADIVDLADIPGIAQFFADNKQNIAELLTSIQEVAKSAKELADIDLSKGINLDTLTQSVLKINMVIDALSSLQAITASGTGGNTLVSGLVGGLEGVFPVFSQFIKLWNNLDEVIQGVIKTYGVFIATASSGYAIVNNSLKGIENIVTGNIGSLEGIIDPQQAYNDAIAASNKALEEYKSKTKEASQAVESATIPVKENTKSNEEQANAQLAAAAAAEKLAKAADEAAAAQAKIDEEMGKAKLDHQRALEDAEIDYQRKLTDIAVEFAQKREDAARDNLQKLADIQDDYQEDVSDAALDLSREEEDIARKFGQDRIDLETENRQKILDIETEYRQKLEDIQTQFNLDADEAEQKRDAVSFLKAVKEKNEAIAAAETDRQRQISEQQVTNEQKLEDQRTAQARELEEARIANERKLEDLRTNLNRQIEEQNTAYARQLEDLAINEARKNEEAAVARERDIEDAKLAYERKLEDLKASLEAEYALIQEYNALLEAEAMRHAEAMAAANALASEAGASAGGITPGITGGGDRGAGGSSIPNRPLRDIPGFAEGGTVPGPMGQPRLVVAHGGETITPPGQPVLMPTFGGGMGGSVTNSRQTNVNLPLATPEQILSPFLMAQIRNMMVRTLGDVD